MSLAHLQTEKIRMSIATLDSMKDTIENTRIMYFPCM